MFVSKGLSPKTCGKKPSNESREECNLTLQDVICPICYLIMIEPVVMPCNHGLCMACFQETVAKNALACPFCKKRISIWLRDASKKKRVIHADLWDWIKENFKDKVERRLKGLDDSGEEDYQPNTSLRISPPGEIKEEFTSQLKQLEEEERSRREKEEVQSLLLISKIKSEEEEEMIKLRTIRREIPSRSPSLSLPQKATSHLSLKRKRLLKRTQHPFYPLASSTPKQLSLDFFLKRSSTDPSSTKPFKRKFLRDITTICSSDSDDSREFPIDTIKGEESRHSTTNGDKENDSVRRTTVFATSSPDTPKNKDERSQDLFCDLEEKISSNGYDCSLTNNATTSHQSKEAPCQWTAGDETRACVAAIADGEMSEEFLSKLIEEQKRLEDRLKQEKEDGLLAIQLQKDMKKVNRSKGSEDEYCLRKRISDYLLPSSSKNPPQKRPLERDKSPHSSPFERLSKSPRY